MYKKAFTLVELIVVIAIIAILAAGLLVGLNPMEMIARSKDATTLSQATEIGKASERMLIGINGDYKTLIGEDSYAFMDCASMGNSCYAINYTDDYMNYAGHTYKYLIQKLQEKGEIKASLAKKVSTNLDVDYAPVLKFVNEDGLMKLFNICYRPHSQQELSKAIYNADGTSTPTNGSVTCGVKSGSSYPNGVPGKDVCHICLYDHRP